MKTNMIALGLSVVLVAGLLVSIGLFSLILGAINRYLLGRPKWVFLKSNHGSEGLAFSFDWNDAQEPATFDQVRVVLYSSTGIRKEVVQKFDPADYSFARDVKFSPGLKGILALLESKNAKNFIVEVSVFSSLDGITFTKEMTGDGFYKLLLGATKTVADLSEEQDAFDDTPEYGVVPRGIIADTVPGKGGQIVVPSNPAFASYFESLGSAGGSAGGGAGGQAQENFKVAKVWIDPGCIVCNACEDIFPEVFEVQAKTCIIRPNAPLDDGLKIQEAAEACPVEVIKFDKAG